MEELKDSIPTRSHTNSITKEHREVNRNKDISKIQQIYKDLVPKVPESKENCTVTFPDGKIVELPLLTGSMGPPMIDVRNLYGKSGYFTFDPGFTNTGSCVSQITYIDGEKGELLYRGYKIQDVAENCDFIETCYLLLYGELPSSEDKRILVFRVRSFRV